jgi:hypothetical protein
MKKAEKICPGEKSATRKFLKRKVKRARRRRVFGVTLLATTRVKDHTRGWST